jgi:hypothetical protein
MNLKNPKAFIPFRDKQLTLRVSNPTRSESDSVIVSANVIKGNPYQMSVGSAAMAEMWSVSFETEAYVGRFPVTRGSFVEEDTLSRAWPKLTVQGVYTCGSETVLLCSADQPAGGRK